MKAIKCDRCGKYYDEDNRYREDVFYIYKCVVKQNEHIDLCDGCLKSLADWFIMKRSTEKSCDTCKYEYLATSKQPCRGCKTESNWEAKE